MRHRLTHRYDIVSRSHAPAEWAAAEDFVTDWTASSERFQRPAGALAYCADLAAERVVFTLHTEAALGRLFAAPFMFPEQRRLASQLLSVPFEQLGPPGEAAPPIGPVLVFSPGRTGSTLLTRLLAAAGRPCASEPAMLAQVAWMGEEHRTRREGTATLLAGACIGSLCRVLGPDTVIKLRSQCNERPLAMVDAARGCRVVFMLRRVESWAISRHRVFAESPVAVAAVLRQAVDALDTLCEAGVAFDVLWFETLAADPAAALRACAPGLQADPALLCRVMRRDSQHGTDIARSVVAGRRVADGFMPAFEAAWAAAGIGAARNARSASLLARMWGR